jgi:hypothetical protein
MKWAVHAGRPGQLFRGSEVLINPPDTVTTTHYAVYQGKACVADLISHPFRTTRLIKREPEVTVRGHTLGNSLTRFQTKNLSANELVNRLGFVFSGTLAADFAIQPVR